MVSKSRNARVSRTQRCFVVILFLLVAIPALSEADSSGIAFDRIQWHAISATPLPPGSFQADYAKIMAQVKPTDVYPYPAQGIHGNLNAPRDAAEPTFTSLYRFSYLGDWARVDDPIAMTAVVTRPDLNELIFLNLSARTFHIVATTPTPGPPAVGSATPLQEPTSTPSVYNYQIVHSSEAVAPTIIDGVPVVGQHSLTTFTTLHTSNSCHLLTMAMSLTEYRATDYHAPATMEPHGLGGTAESCTTRIESPENSANPGLLVYSSVELRVEAVVLGLRVRPGPIASVDEYGNIARLSAQDLSLFGIPAGFTLEQ